MSNPVIEALHDVHTATNDVLKGYREMKARAEPEIQALVQRLIDMHQRHASEQKAQLAMLRESGKDDTSMQGTLNKVVVVLRDWITDLDRDMLPAVRRGEESLRGKYDTALDDSAVKAAPSIFSMLVSQRAQIADEITRLPS